MVQDCIRLINNIKLQESYSLSLFCLILFPRGESRIKVTGMLKVSLKSINCRFWC